MPLDTALLSANLLSSQIGLLRKGAPKEIFTKVRQKAIETTNKNHAVIHLWNKVNIFCI